MANKEELLDKLRRLKRSIKNDPTVMARYDIDEDGRISVEEWDLAREEMILGLKSEKASAHSDEPGKRADTVSENIDTADIEIPDNASGYDPIRVESFWGAIAMFCLCQLYYFILFEGFVFISGVTGPPKKLFYVWFGILFLVLGIDGGGCQKSQRRYSLNPTLGTYECHTSNHGIQLFCRQRFSW